MDEEHEQEERKAQEEFEEEEEEVEGGRGEGKSACFQQPPYLTHGGCRSGAYVVRAPRTGQQAEAH